MSRLCEEFGGYPVEAYRQWLQSPVGLLETIVEYRAFARAKQAYDGMARLDDESRRTLFQDPMVQLVREIDFGQVQAAREADREAELRARLTDG